jgi:hypothetical protein
MPSDICVKVELLGNFRCGHANRGAMREQVDLSASWVPKGRGNCSNDRSKLGRAQLIHSSTVLSRGSIGPGGIAEQG